jgi:hypothetical protein
MFEVVRHFLRHLDGADQRSESRDEDWGKKPPLGRVWLPAFYSRNCNAAADVCPFRNSNAPVTQLSVSGRGEDTDSELRLV